MDPSRDREESESARREESSPPLGIRHVLVPLDGSLLAACVLPFVAAVAGAFGARITLLRVLQARHQPAAERHVDLLEWEIWRAGARHDLGRIAGELEAFGLPTAVEIVSGDAAEQIIVFAEKEHVDLIVLSTHGEGGLSIWLLSSTVQKVMLRAPTSVLVVPAYASRGLPIGTLHLGKILLPLDCSARAECLLPLAVALTRAHDGELILAHIVPEPELLRRMCPSAEDLRLAAQFIERNRAEAERHLTELQNRILAQGARARVRILVESHCDRALRRLADEEDVDLVLLSAHGRTGDAAERYGTVAAALMQRGGRPMIIVQDLAGVLHPVNLAEDAVREHFGH